MQNSNSTQTSDRQRERGLILTEEALGLLDEALRKWWETSERRQKSKTGKLTREAKEEGLGLAVNTIDRIYNHKPVDLLTLQTAFDSLNIFPPFSKELCCVSPSLSAFKSNLPYQSTRFIERAAEVAAIQELLESTSLMTLTGTGGVGKSRLAIQVGTEAKDHFPAGIVFVELAGVDAGTDLSIILQKVAVAFGIQEQTHQPLIQTLFDFLHQKPLLLILDNCEHVLAACAILVDRLLAASSQLKVLATSRERLNIPSECPYRVPSLPIPDLKWLSDTQKDTVSALLEYASVQLFVERAGVHRSDFTVTEENAPLLVAICQRLDGIPLALELAAARLRSMPLDILERGLSDCFRLLTGGSRAGLSRHQTLRATMDWSYDLLMEKERALLGRLSVFADGCQQEAAEVVCACDGIAAEEVLDLLTSLVDKNLVIYEEREGRARYRLLETVRQYGRDRLSESKPIRERHRDYFLALAEEAEIKLVGTDQAEWLRRLDTEYENLRSALDWCLSVADSTACFRFCKALLRLWTTRGYLSEGREFCERALALGGNERTPERALGLNGAGILAYYQAEYEAAAAYHEEGLSICRQIEDLHGIARALTNLGLVFANQPDLASALTCYEESLVICQENGDRYGAACALNNLGAIAEARRDYTTARAYYEESLLLFREFGDQKLIANSLKNVGCDAYLLGDYEAALDAFDDGLTICQMIGDRQCMANTLSGQACVVEAQGDFVSARAIHEESLSISREIGDRGGTAYQLILLGKMACSREEYGAGRSQLKEGLLLWQAIGNRLYIAPSLEALASLAASESKPNCAAILWGAAEAIWEEIGSSRPSGEQAEYDRSVTAMRQTLGTDFEEGWRQGRSLSIKQAIAFALKTPRS